MADHDDDRSRRLLKRIAQTVGVPPETFFADIDAERGVPSGAEEAELLVLFRGLRDPGDRRRCIELIRAVVDLRCGDPQGQARA